MDATLTKKGPLYSLGFERSLPHAPHKVWRVLTERELLTQWFPSDVVGDWFVGAKLRFVFSDGQGDGLPEEELRGEVVTVEPPRLLEFRWGSSFFRCELIAEGEGCRLLFSESFEDASIASRNAAGWEWCLGNLEALLQGAALAKFVLDEWHGRFEHYVAEFQPRVGPQQGPPESHPDVAAERGEQGKRP